ncbi:hypothetical protein NDU88_005726 [Pleurodeles waltl]|uniref:Uncharacterized protein n=1 Tax=Pleurodeles waltl TaxID=8319 RepID=A0AAV7NS91_PLEWA|nr:hypothetical protein NDU88_005726 [Pleurodeles waltl]
MGLVGPASAGRTGECGVEERGRRKARQPLDEDILIYPVWPGQLSRESARECKSLTRGHLAACSLGCTAQRGRARRKRMR